MSTPYRANTLELIARHAPRINFLDPESHCWTWEGATRRDGYGVIGVSGKTLAVHRVIYEALVGPIPEGLVVDHLCRNKLCVNPMHMQVVTREENTALGGLRKTHCPQGHPYDEKNTRYTGKGHRQCRACQAAYHAGWQQRKRAKQRRDREEG